MKKRENKEFLKKIKEIIKDYDSNGVIIDSCLIGGSEKIFTPNSVDTPEQIYSSNILYCTVYVSAEGVSNPKKVLVKTQLMNDCVNKIIDASFKNKEVTYTNSSSIRIDDDD